MSFWKWLVLSQIMWWMTFFTLVGITSFINEIDFPSPNPQETLAPEVTNGK